jgi:hypothetical protein
MKLAVNADENAGHRHSRSPDGAMAESAWHTLRTEKKQAGHQNDLFW